MFSITLFQICKKCSRIQEDPFLDAAPGDNTYET